MTASVDSSFPTKALSHFYDHTFFCLFLHVFLFIIDIVVKGIPGPPLSKAPTPFPACPLFKIFVCTTLFSVSPPFQVF